MEKNQPDDEELLRFRTEAQKLLEIPATAPKQEEKTNPVGAAVNSQRRQPLEAKRTKQD